jgi:Calcineurin-like phosphoesterase
MRKVVILLLTLLFALVLASPAWAESATFEMHASDYDDFVEKAGTAYPPDGFSTHTADERIWAYRGLYSGTYYVDNGLMSWETAPSIPDNATITSAKLVVDILSVDNANSLSLTADGYEWGPTPGSEDFSHASQTGALSATPLSSFSVGDQVEIPLENPNTWVDKNDGTWTELRFHVTQRASDAAPTGDNGLSFASWDHATADPPTLEVDYTLPAPQGAIFAGAGDIADVGNADEATGNIIEGLGPGAIAWTAGDNAYPNGTLDNFNTKYEPAWGSFKARTWPTPGNHDYRTTNASGYKSYFDAGTLEQATPIGTQTYYAQDIGGWRWYFLDSNIGATTSSAQYGWLQQDLNANVSPGECVGAIWHHPVVSTGAHGSGTKMRAIFALLDQAAYDADLVLEGHDHNYERFAKHSSTGAASTSGTESVVVGTGGTAHRAFTLNPLPVTVKRNADTHGVLVGELTPTGGSFEFRRANYSGNGTFTDQFTVSCN